MVIQEVRKSRYSLPPGNHEAITYISGLTVQDCAGLLNELRAIVNLHPREALSN